MHGLQLIKHEESTGAAGWSQLIGFKRKEWADDRVVRCVRVMRRVGAWGPLGKQASGHRHMIPNVIWDPDGAWAQMWLAGAH